jgi:hypothetical protein
MALPVSANTTCDIYRAGRAPPAAPDVAGVKCFLSADYSRRMETGEGDPSSYHYTHTMLVDSGTDVRDALANFTQPGVGDSVYVPDQTGTPFVVRCVERCGRGTGMDLKKVYLDRRLPSWPTNNL